MERGSRRIAVLAAAAAVLAGGCCTVPPAAGRYFDRQDTFTTVNGFVYAIDAGDYDFAYDCLTEESRTLFPKTKFKLALRFNFEVPQVKIPIRDLIIDARRHRYLANDREGGPRKGKMILWYYIPHNDNIIEVPIYTVRETEAQAEAAGREDPIWSIDLEKTLRLLEGIDFSRIVGEPQA